MTDLRGQKQVERAAKRLVRLCTKYAGRGAPETLLFEAETLIDEERARGTGAALQALMSSLAERLRQPRMRNIVLQHGERLTKRAHQRIERHDAGRALWKLLLSLENGSLGAAIPLYRDIVGLQELSLDVMRPGRELQLLRREREPEVAAKLLMQIASIVAQPAYERLLRLLWRIYQVQTGHREGFRSMGRANEVLSPLFPSMLHADFVKIRNAAAHQRYRFEVRTATLHAFDKQGGTASFELDQLFEIVLTAYMASGPLLQEVVGAYTQRWFTGSGILRASLDAISSHPSPPSVPFEVVESRAVAMMYRRWENGPEWTSPDRA